MITKRGVIVWISGFLTFLSIMTSFYMVIQLINLGTSTIISPYILSGIFGSLTVETYLWISIIATFLLLGLTSIIIYIRQPPDPELVKLLLKVGGNLAALRKSQEASIAEIVTQMDYGRKVNERFFSNVSTELQEDKKEMASLLEKQSRSVKKLRSDLVSAIEAKSTETGEKLSADLRKQEAVMTGVKRISEEGAKSMKNQLAELEEIKLRLDRIEGTMEPNQANLGSLDNPEDIKGIGPALGSELRMLGINSVGEFLTTDPEVIGGKTRVSKEMAENLQASAQLMMIPGIDSNDADLLVEAGVKSRKELANQDLIELSKKVGEIAKIHVAQGKISNDENPSIEEISTWIRNAR